MTFLKPFQCLSSPCCIQLIQLQTCHWGARHEALATHERRERDAQCGLFQFRHLRLCQSRRLWVGCWALGPAAKKDTFVYCRHGELWFSTFFLTRFSSVLGGLDCFSLVIISLDLGGDVWWRLMILGIISCHIIIPSLPGLWPLGLCLIVGGTPRLLNRFCLQTFKLIHWFHCFFE